MGIVVIKERSNISRKNRLKLPQRQPQCSHYSLREGKKTILNPYHQFQKLTCNSFSMLSASTFIIIFKYEMAASDFVQRTFFPQKILRCFSGVTFLRHLLQSAMA